MNTKITVYNTEGSYIDAKQMIFSLSKFQIEYEQYLQDEHSFLRSLGLTDDTEGT